MIEMDAVFAISEYGKKLDMVMPIVDENCQEIRVNFKVKNILWIDSKMKFVAKWLIVLKENNKINFYSISGS